MTTKTVAPRTVVLMNEPCPPFDSFEQVKYSICSWSDKQQQDFLHTLFNFQPQKNDRCGCSFGVEYGNTRLYDVGLTPGAKIDVFRNWPDSLKSCGPDEFVIIMKPDTFHDIASNSHCKCGARSSSQCLENLMSGGCTALAIKMLVGIPLFPHLYANKEK